MSWEQMTLVFATHFATEIASVMDHGNGLLRERLAQLDTDERRMLRDALDVLESEAEAQLTPG